MKRVAHRSIVRYCTKCGAPHIRKNQRWCNDCHAEYMRVWRARHPTGT